MSAVDPRDRFSGAAKGYAQHRPSYPPAIVDGVIAAAGIGAGDPVADVGCGTGILTRLLAERGLDVTGIDPNEPMLAEARAAGGPASYRRGEAEATGLAAASTALVTVAQAFHWFDLDKTLAEFHRIIRPGGHVAAIWNLRGAGAFPDDYEALLRRFCREYRVLEGWEECLNRLRNHPRTVSPRTIESPNVQLFDFAGLHGRSWSSSYVIHGVDDREGFDAGLRALFDTHAQGGVLEFPYRTVALVFGIA